MRFFVPMVLPIMSCTSMSCSLLSEKKFLRISTKHQRQLRCCAIIFNWNIFITLPFKLINGIKIILIVFNKYNLYIHYFRGGLVYPNRNILFRFWAFWSIGRTPSASASDRFAYLPRWKVRTHINNNLIISISYGLVVGRCRLQPAWTLDKLP